MKKVLFIAANARSLIANRGDLIRELTSRGHQVHALIPDYDFLPEVEELGISWELIHLSRTGADPFRDYRSYRELKQKIRQFGPDITYGYSIKPVIYGALAARACGVAVRASMITGMGYLFTGNTLKQRLLRIAGAWLYRQAMKASTTIYFQNPDDVALFKSLDIIRAKEASKIVRTNGSGVNMDRFYETRPVKEPVRFLVISRLLEDKGIREFVHAARLLHHRYPEAAFQVVGPLDLNLPHALPEREVESWKAEGLVDFTGGVKDVRPYIESCSVYVLPSYREGTPRSVLEAMAMKRAIITTDTPGCRETVEQEVNGFLVPVKSSEALAAAMEQFLQQPQLIDRMAAESLRICREKYDVTKVNQTILEGLKLHTD
ncbi:Glycosyltransferase involved in cell wall bisynthesis [Cyclonatronum proteinivorum]|uniref:Glycosyltransferase involved in cell wall bisynthesis n=1 Tax=Cyclonatronum proteinivorum TaxID=1457365 RepID=A0A345UMM5_9BACT|nr:glycosyltransferase family 4 protein [Cyclonatronum proteinivorum]AXJ01727.1 Glycosyltransferase involved in cell wall bisynthesis [Cyclonatronum proteinivorum]